MNILVPYFIFAMSFSPEVNYPNRSIEENVYQTDVTIGAEIAEVFNIEGQIKTAMMPNGFASFQPFQDEYYVRAFFEHRGFSLGVEHACFHPVKSTATGVYQFYGGYNKIYFEFDSRDLTH